MIDEEGNEKELTPDEGARAVSYGWAHDGKSFFYGSNKRDARNTWMCMKWMLKILKVK